MALKLTRGKGLKTPCCSRAVASISGKILRDTHLFIDAMFVISMHIQLGACYVPAALYPRSASQRF